MTRSLCVVALCAAALVAVANAQSSSSFFQSGSSFKEDEQTRFETCIPLVSRAGCGCSSANNPSTSGEEASSTETSAEGSGSGSGSGSGDEGEGSGSSSGSGSGSGSGDSDWNSGDLCFLLQVFKTYTITSDLKSIWLEWIQTAQTTIVENTEITEYEKLVQIWGALEVLFVKYPALVGQVLYEKVTGWGYVFEISSLSSDIQQNATCTGTSIQEVITFSGNSCPLTDACTQWANGTAEETAVKVLVKNITAIIQSGTSQNMQFVEIYEAFEAWFVTYAQYKSSLLAYKITEYGSISSFYEICASYWRIRYFSVAVGGSTSSVELVKSLTLLYQNTSYNISERSEFKQLEQSFAKYCSLSATTAYEARMNNFTLTLYQFLIETDFTIKELFATTIEGYGSLADLVYAFVDQQQNGIEFEANSGETGSAESTTPSIESTTPAEGGESSTPAAGGNCADVTSLVKFSSNTTILLEAITEDQTKTDTEWTTSEINQFKPWYTKIYNVCKNETIGAGDAWTQTKKVILNFATPSTQIYQIVQKVFVSETWEATVEAACTCTCTTVTPPVCTGSGSSTIPSS